MARTSILSDELVRQLVAVGQVDVLVGVPTFNNAASIGRLITALHVGLAMHYPRERTAIINTDGGSEDGTLDHVRDAPLADAELRGSTLLRTTHRVSTRVPALPNRGAGLRTVFAAADLLQARAVVVVDGAVTSVRSDWVAELLRPVWSNEAELVLPIHPRGRLEGPLATQLVRPLLSTAYARRLRTSVMGGFACSNRFAARMLRHELWDGDPIRSEFDVWLVATALAEDWNVVQTHLGPCLFDAPASRDGLRELFGHVVGATFGCLDAHAATWLPRAEPRDVPVLGQPREPAGPEPTFDPAPMIDRFRSGVRDLEPLLRDLLRPETLGRLQEAATADGPPRFDDALWVATVYEFAASAHRGVMNREHLTQALVSLYLGRTASFLAEVLSADEAARTERFMTLEREYEASRPYLVERWNAERGR